MVHGITSHKFQHRMPIRSEFPFSGGHAPCFATWEDVGRYYDTLRSEPGMYSTQYLVLLPFIKHIGLYFNKGKKRKYIKREEDDDEEKEMTEQSAKKPRVPLLLLSPS